MKKLILLTVLTIAFSLNSYSQQPTEAVQVTKLSAFSLPKTVYRMGLTSVSVWEEKKTGKYGKYIEKTFAVKKRYKKDDKWLDSNTYTLKELLQLKAIIDKAISEEAVEVENN